MTDREYRPRWHCRIHIYHRWRRYRVDDGGGGGDYQARDYYLQCLDCGKIRDVPIGVGGA